MRRQRHKPAKDALSYRLRDSGHYRDKRFDAERERLSWAVQQGDTAKVKRLERRLDELLDETLDDIAPGKTPGRLERWKLY
ncbi:MULTISPECIES: hypothetical protein [Vreelandella]|nr:MULTISPECIES: hypothetical protein [Halomonas]